MNLIGQTLLDRYRVNEYIGRGGMAEVYKVWDSHRSATLAMKVLNADLSQDRAFLRRFRREAQTLEHLQHPSIVRFFGLEQKEDLVFILMDYVEGVSLKKKIFDADGPMSLDQVREIIVPLCQALQYAHNERFVHSDIKPANVLIDKYGRAMLSDFGIARMTEASTTVTMVGAGTPAYMAPEQARGENPGPQTDIYSLGIVLYEMLTGERPFSGDHAKTGGSTSEKLRWEQMYLAPPSPRKHNPKISLALEAVVLKCLEKEPGRRYPSALAVLNAFLSTLEGIADQTKMAKPIANRLPENGKVTIEENVPAHPAGEEGREKPARKFDSRQIRIAGIIMIVLLCGILGTIYAINNWPGVTVSTPTPNPLFTPAPLTFAMALTQTAFAQPTLTFTPQPSATNTFAPVTFSPLGANTPAAQVTSACDVLIFVTDVTVIDGTLMAPGQVFPKTWRIQNGGTCTWTPTYKVVFTGSGIGPMGGVTTPIGKAVKPGEYIDITVTFTAPAAAGDYSSWWKLQNDSGIWLGGSPFLVAIKVVGPTAGPTNTPTETPIATP